VERRDPTADDAARLLRALPAVHELAARLDGPHTLSVAAARQAIEEQRQASLAGKPDAEELEPRARELLAAMQRPSLRRVINATGVIIHTNLGRAPLPAAARDAVAAAATGYSNLELDLQRGERGSRHAHVEGLLEELTGSEGAVVVNNGAAAVLLAVAALAGPGSALAGPGSALAGRGRAVAVSRGQLVEIGGGFRIPDVVAQSGARLVEVGTTNRTRLSDYERVLALDPDAVLLRVHQSNFRAVGFVEDVSTEGLCGLGAPVIDDVGSGVLADAAGIPALGEEPSIKRSLQAGAAIVCCSGDKLLGGPQAGLIIGKRAAVAAARAHPLARAMRIDKLSLAALEATLRLYRDPELARREIPVLSMLDAGEPELAARARRLAEGIGKRSTVVRSVAKVGGGALPLLELEGPAVALEAEAAPAELARKLRGSDPPVLARIHEGRVLLDPRTVRDDELAPLVAAAQAATGR
jgi:L-seryl-tRNA(Ser) seleniumtransferase